MSDRKVKRLTPNSIANLVMADEAWHDSLYVRAEDYDSLLADFEALRKPLAAPRLEVTVDPRLTSEEAAAISAALAAEQPKPEPVAAQHRFRFPRSSTLWARKIGSPDWGRWHECKVANRPAWEIDSQGWEVQYRPLYTAPPDIEALRREDEP